MTAVLEATYSPRGAFIDVIESRDPEVCAAGAAGTGKSLACLHKVNTLALLHPGMRGLIVRKTQTSLASSALASWRKFVIPQLLRSGAVYFHGGGPQDPPQYRYPNGSIINVGGMDRATRIMSTEYDIVYANEATELTLDDWEAITTRLRSWVMPFQQLLADCNPAQPTHWLKARADAGRLRMIPTRHEDNPALFNDDGTRTPTGIEYIGKLDALTGVRYLRLRKGIWAAADGVIYDGWDESTHLVDPFPVPPSWPRYWAVDFGYTHPFVLQCWAEDPDGRLYMYREIFRTGRTVDQHADTIMAIVAPGGAWIEPKPTAVICDHDAEGRATFRQKTGLPTTAARKKVLDGIQAVQRRLRPAGDGRPRLYLMRGATIERDPELVDAKQPASTAEEIPGYIWQANKEAPVKEHDDGNDTMRYMVAHRDLGARVKTRFL